jgi:hypothetical protein
MEMLEDGMWTTAVDDVEAIQICQGGGEGSGDSVKGAGVIVAEEEGRQYH